MNVFGTFRRLCRMRRVQDESGEGPGRVAGRGQLGQAHSKPAEKNVSGLLPKRTTFERDRNEIAPPVPTVVEQLLTVPEVARLLRVSDWYVYELIKRREIPSIRIGRWIRVERNALTDWMANGGTSEITTDS